ncbi:Putative coenzyme F420-dependent oxidoreductase [Mycobacterium talmoniae]|uniref:Coenzyme F420-dependent oxidoreductase n=1 Tax=Mycobacterium talmoniae TaxID=1858794 RepID=A0A2S8BE54_9MYCO|nr:Putative coenzyme F420-dependent oxidoreductase [Mycobacterium talmoniae]
MRLGVMIGAERGDSARKVTKLLDDIEWAEAAGMDTAWIPQVPTDFDALTAVALMATRTTRIELGTAVVPLQTQHPIALARQALSVHAAAGGRLALGVGPSHHWIIGDMLGLPYERPAAYTRDYLQVLNAALSGPGPVDVANDTFTVHNPLDLGPVAPLPVLVAALGPVMLGIAGELTDGTVLWMADERAIGDHIAPRITKAADNAGGPPRASSPESRSAYARQRKSTRRGSGPTGSSARPRSRRTTSGYWNAVTPKTSVTCAPPATRRPSWPGSAALPTPG